MLGDHLEPPDRAVSPAAQRWNDAVAAVGGVVSPVPPFADVRGARSTAWAREVLPPLGGTVLDIGCGGGDGALALVPPATEVIGVDPRGVLLDDFVAAAVERGVARRTVHGMWPDVVTVTPIADVAICQHVVQSIDDIVPFVLTLTDRARLAVVVEVPVEHPSAPMRSLAESLDADGGDRVRSADLLAVLAELGIAPETSTDERIVADGAATGAFSDAVGDWLGLGADRDREIVERVGEHVVGRSVEVLTLRWPGAADAVI